MTLTHESSNREIESINNGIFMKLMAKTINGERKYGGENNQRISVISMAALENENISGIEMSAKRIGEIVRAA
jgi:hypothetical protein